MEIHNLTNYKDHEIISWSEIILYDVLHNIFGYLNIYDLNQASKVCKSWYHAAQIEKLKRGPQILILKALEDLVATGFSSTRSLENDSENIDDFNCSLRIRPRIGLFFTDGKYPTSADCDSVPFEICRSHQWTQPEISYYVAIESLGVYVNNETITGVRNATAAAFLPVRPGLEYAVTETSSHQIEKSVFDNDYSILNDMTNKLFENYDHHHQQHDHHHHRQQNICFIIFIYHWKEEPSYEADHADFLTRLLDRLRARYEPGTYSLWGGAINDIFAMDTNCTKPLRHSTSFCAIRISGPSVNSWSIVISTNLSNVELAAKLQEFKSQLRLNSSALALLILPKSDEQLVDDCSIRVFKDAFPGVTLLSIVNDRSHTVFSVDTIFTERNQKLEHLNSYAYVIITYK